MTQSPVAPVVQFIAAFEEPIHDRGTEDAWLAGIEAAGAIPMTSEDVAAIRSALASRAKVSDWALGIALAALHRNPASTLAMLREDLASLRGSARIRVASAAMRGPAAREAVDAIADEVRAGHRGSEVAFSLAEAVAHGGFGPRGFEALRMHFDCTDWLLRWHAAQTIAYAAGARSAKDGPGGELFVHFAASPLGTFRSLAQRAAEALEAESPFVNLARSLARPVASEAMKRFSESVVAAKAGAGSIDLQALAALEPDERLQASYVLTHQAVSRESFMPPFPDALRVFVTDAGKGLPYARALLIELSTHPVEALAVVARELVAGA